MMSREQADAIAVLVHTLRPEWDVRGTMTALAQCREREPSAVAIAAVRAATTESNRTPAVIPLAGPHWDNPGVTRAPAAPAPFDPTALGVRQPPEVAARGVAAARAALRGETP